MSDESHQRSAAIAAFLALVLIAASLVLKDVLSSSRTMTLIAGGMGGFEFLFLLTALSNWQMASSGKNAKCGISEVLICLLVSALSCSFVHRVAVTVSILSSIFLLTALTNISRIRYSPASTSTAATTAPVKKRK